MNTCSNFISMNYMFPSRVTLSKMICQNRFLIFDLIVLVLAEHVFTKHSNQNEIFQMVFYSSGLRYASEQVSGAGKLPAGERQEASGEREQAAEAAGRDPGLQAGRQQPEDLRFGERESDDGQGDDLLQGLLHESKRPGEREKGTGQTGLD